MITPIRGRKTFSVSFPNQLFLVIRNDNPDKGTEGCGWAGPAFIGMLRLEMITPIRGRKGEYGISIHIFSTD